MAGVWRAPVHAHPPPATMNSSTTDTEDLDLTVFDPHTQAALIRGKIKTMSCSFFANVSARNVTCVRQATDNATDRTAVTGCSRRPSRARHPKMFQFRLLAPSICSKLTKTALNFVRTQIRHITCIEVSRLNSPAPCFTWHS